MRTIRFLSDQEIFDRSVNHLLSQRRTGILANGGAAYRGPCGGCPVGSFIRPSDYRSAMEGVPVRYLPGSGTAWPRYMDAGVTSLCKALLNAGIDIYDKRTVALLVCLQNVHDIYGVWDWTDRLLSIAREYGLSSECILSVPEDCPASEYDARSRAKHPPRTHTAHARDSPRMRSTTPPPSRCADVTARRPRSARGI